MTAARIPAETLGAVQIPEIPLDRLRESFNNPRKSFDPGAQAELVESIRQHGIQSPLIIRVFPDSALHAVKDTPAVRAGELFEIVCGHRRFRAAQELGLTAVPCIQRQLTDDQAQELGLVDNVQREHVPALEEADAYEELRKRLGTAAAIAARVGKDVAYVTKRLQLIALSEMPRRALAERLITIDHALLLARLGEQEQLVNLKWLLNPNAGVKEKVEDVIAGRLKDRAESKSWGWHEPQSPLRLKMHIEEHVGRKLKRAPWDLDATNMTPDGVACSGCPSNTRDNTALFGDLEIDEATCENGRCFEVKRETFVHIALTGAGDGAVKLSWRDSTAAPRFVKETGAVNTAQTFRHGQWIEAKKKSCEHVVAGVTVDWSDDNRYGFGPASSKLRKPGELLSVCVAAKCKAHPKAWEKTKRSAAAERTDPKAHEEQQKRKREAAIAESKLRMAAAEAAVDAVRKLPEAALRGLLLALNRSSEAEALVPGLGKYLETAPLDSVNFAKAVAVLSIDSIRSNEWQEPKQRRGDFLASLKRLGYDASGLWSKAKPAAKKAAAKPAPKVTAKAKRAVVGKAIRAKVQEAHQRLVKTQKAGRK